MNSTITKKTTTITTSRSTQQETSTIPAVANTDTKKVPLTIPEPFAPFFLHVRNKMQSKWNELKKQGVALDSPEYFSLIRESHKELLNTLQPEHREGQMKETDYNRTFQQWIPEFSNLELAEMFTPYENPP